MRLKLKHSRFFRNNWTEYQAEFPDGLPGGSSLSIPSSNGWLGGGTAVEFNGPTASFTAWAWDTAYDNVDGLESSLGGITATRDLLVQFSAQIVLSSPLTKNAVVAVEGLPLSPRTVIPAGSSNQFPFVGFSAIRSGSNMGLSFTLDPSETTQLGYALLTVIPILG